MNRVEHVLNLLQITMGIVTFNYWTIAGLAVDVMMSGILARFCWKHKTGIEHIDSAVMRYFIVATESSLWPGLCLLIAVILFHSGNVGGPSNRAPALILVKLPLPC